jgi:hypothetical protein
MLNALPPVNPRRSRRTKARPIRVTPPVGALTLVSATYTAGATPELVLTFSRAIDVSAIDGWAIAVNDGAIAGELLVATGGATMEGPAAVRLGLEAIASASGPTTVLIAEANNGIVAAGDGASWAGVTDLLLPFP